MNIFIAISSRSASGQEVQDKNLAFAKDLNPSSYSKVVEDESLIREIVSTVREVGNTIMSNSLCSIIDDIDRCDSVVLSLTSYLSDINFEDATSKIDEVKDRLADFQQYPTFETWMVTKAERNFAYLFNISWLGYNIVVGPYADQGFTGILPFLPFLVYTFILVNYFEEYYFRTNLKRVVIWAFLHIVMGVSVSVALMLLPLGLFYKYIYDKYGVNYAYALHFSTNITILLISIVSFIAMSYS